MKKSDIVNLLMSNDRAVVRALVVLHNLQTEDERASRATWHTNNRGFNAPDAKKLSAFAEKVKNNQRLTSDEISQSRNRVLKYAEQLLLIAKAKALAKALEAVA